MVRWLFKVISQKLGIFPEAESLPRTWPLKAKDISHEAKDMRHKPKSLCRCYANPYTLGTYHYSEDHNSDDRNSERSGSLSVWLNISLATQFGYQPYAWMNIRCTLPGKHHMEVGAWFILFRTEICQRPSTSYRPVIACKLLQRSRSMLRGDATAYAA